jgi:AhpD family alkylhydroperoxidase
LQPDNKQKRNEKRESKMKNIQPRMKNPAMLIPDAMQPLMAFVAAVRKSGVSQRTLDLVHLRASQINGCSFCVDMGSRELKKASETDDRLFSVAAWREAPFFTESERAALALAEAGYAAWRPVRSSTRGNLERGHFAL